MTRRERLENKIEKRKEWAQGRKAEASRRFALADKDGEAFYGGQPILVGHHSEKRARALQDKIHSNGFAGVDNLKMAKHHEEKAEGLKAYIDSVIFDDDPDAIEQVEARIAGLEKYHNFMLAVNKICKNKKLDEAGKIVELIKLDIPEDKAGKILHPEREWQAVGFESFQLTNNGAKIRRYKERLVSLNARKVLKERAENSSGGVIIDNIWNGTRARITFSEKPSREIIDSLKGAGFRWSKTFWIGDSYKVPKQVLIMANDKNEEVV